MNWVICKKLAKEVNPLYLIYTISFLATVWTGGNSFGKVNKIS